MTGLAKPKTVLITGCSTNGLGHALALEYSKSGFHVIATARNPSRMQDLVDRADIDTVTLDVTDTASIAAAKESVLKITDGTLDILVNCAGGSYVVKPAIELSDEDLAIVDLNFHAAVRMVTAFSPLILAAGKGAMIVNISSMAGSMPVPYMAMYCGAKAALDAYSDTLRVELKPFGINVMTVISGTVQNAADIKNSGRVFIMKLAQDSPYKSNEEHFHKSMREANANPTPSSVWARSVVNETLKSRPRAVWWTGGSSSIGWFLITFFPRFVLDFICFRIAGFDKLSTAPKRKAD